MKMKQKLLLLTACLGLASLTAVAQTKTYKDVWCADQGDGTYVNPVLNGDFPDIDVIRVDDTYYFVSTTMYHFPGATILKSKDLVNWEYCANPLLQIDDNDAYNLNNERHHYSQGQWAASLNYHDGKFYLYFICYGRSGVDDTQNILLTTTDPEGEWKMQKWPEHYYDAGWLFDDGENGDGYLYVACGIGDIWVNKLNANTLQKITSTKVISVGNGCEGCHMYHIGDYYYIYATYGGTEGSQTIFRSKNPMGPYEEHNGRVFANQKIHQGALIETQTGEWWTMLFKDAGSIGRIPYLEPVKWVDGWPVIGNNGRDVSENGKTYKKPDVGKVYEQKYLPTTDAFNSDKLGMQWAWNHNPDNSAWSLTERPGHLRLHTANVTNELNWAHNSLSQRIMGYSPNGTPNDSYRTSHGLVKLDVSGMKEGDVTGLAVFQNPYSFIGVKMENGKKFIYSERCSFNSQQLKKEDTKIGPEITSDTVYLHAYANFGTNVCRYFYGYDGKKWTSAGVTMSMRYTLDYFVGQRFYLFNYATKRLGGYVDFDWFSTELAFNEEDFGIPGALDNMTEDDKEMSSLSMERPTIELLAGGIQTLDIQMTAKSGLKRNVASACEYVFANPGILSIEAGRAMALRDGETDVTATYTDAQGNAQEVTFHVKASAFPLTTELFNPSIVKSGTFTKLSKAYAGQGGGIGGWKYASGIDMSDYPYLVVKLLRTSASKITFYLYDQDNTQATPYTYDMGAVKEAVIDLREVKNASGKAIDLSNVYIAGFSQAAQGTVYFKEIYLSKDGENPATGISAVRMNDEHVETPVYDLSGREVQVKSRGVYIQNGKKVMVK